MPHHGLAADEGDVHRFIATHDVDDAVNEIITAEIGHFAEVQFSAKMGIAVGIASGAMQRTLARNFNRKNGKLAGKDTAPCDDQVMGIHALLDATACFIETIWSFKKKR